MASGAISFATCYRMVRKPKIYITIFLSIAKYQTTIKCKLQHYFTLTNFLYQNMRHSILALHNTYKD